VLEELQESHAQHYQLVYDEKAGEQLKQFLATAGEKWRSAVVDNLRTLDFQMRKSSSP
jgi:hypothetical protein